MTSIEELRNAIKQVFDNATDKQLIDSLSNINSLVDNVAKDQTTLESKNAELIQSYKDIVQHTSFKPKENEPSPDCNQQVEAPKLEDFFK